MAEGRKPPPKSMRALAKSHGPWKWWLQGPLYSDSQSSLNPVERKVKQPDAATFRRQYKEHYAAVERDARTTDVGGIGRADVSIHNPPDWS
tara:strand:- start:17022 stop:17294 length:273 start_codon:yes stop_codon:yes gene_type:complete